MVRMVLDPFVLCRRCRSIGPAANGNLCLRAISGGSLRYNPKLAVFELIWQCVGRINWIASSKIF
jgi:hypothetical protein